MSIQEQENLICTVEWVSYCCFVTICQLVQISDWGGGEAQIDITKWQGETPSQG